MKKNLVAVVLLTTFLTACGGATTEQEVKSNDEFEFSDEEKELAKELESELTDEDKELIAEIDTALNEEAGEKSTIETEEGEQEDPLTEFEPLQEIIDADLAEGKIQIGPDMILALYDMTFADVDALLKSSVVSDRYEWDNATPFLDENNTKHNIFIDGKKWLSLRFKRPGGTGDDMVKLEEALLVDVSILDPYYAYFAKGIKSNGGGLINYENIDSVLNDYKSCGNGDPLPFNANAWQKIGNDYTISVSSKYAEKSAGIGKDSVEVKPIFYEYTLKMDGGTGEIKQANCYSETALNWLEEYGLNEEDFIILDYLR